MCPYNQEVDAKRLAAYQAAGADQVILIVLAGNESKFRRKLDAIDAMIASV